MRVVLLQRGSRRNYIVPQILFRAGILERFFTDAYVGNKPWLQIALGVVPSSLRPNALERWAGRVAPGLPAELVVSFDAFGILTHIRTNLARTRKAEAQIFATTSRSLNERVGRFGLGAADTVWGFNGSCLDLFKLAKKRGLLCVLEQVKAPYRVAGRLLREETIYWKGWQPSLHAGVDAEPLANREEAEWRLADLILCGSQFVVDGVAERGGPVEKCVVVPYGVDLNRFVLRPPRRRQSIEPLHVLFAGEVGLRKGAPYLLEALKKVGSRNVQARFAGKITVPGDKLDAYRGVSEFLGLVPRLRMHELWSWADVLVLPSLCEGSAAVTYEAVASGVRVICTPNTGVLPSDWVDLVPCRNSDALVAALEAHIDHPRTEEAISQKTRDLYGLDAYAERLLAAVTNLHLGPSR